MRRRNVTKDTVNGCVLCTELVLSRPRRSPRMRSPSRYLRGSDRPAVRSGVTAARLKVHVAARATRGSQCNLAWPCRAGIELHPTPLTR